MSASSVDKHARRYCFRTPLTSTSVIWLGCSKPRMRETFVAHVVVSCVVVSLAKTPFSAAQPPDAMA